MGNVSVTWIFIEHARHDILAELETNKNAERYVLHGQEEIEWMMQHRAKQTRAYRQDASLN
jgi:hypothetical protein